MRASIKEKREVAEGTLLVLLDLGGAELDYLPGQYFWVELLDPPYQDEKGARRHITAVTSPSERGVLGLCTRLRDSAFKRSLAELPVGPRSRSSRRRGRSCCPTIRRGRSSFVAGGIGITPFRSMLRYIEDERLPHRVTLIYSSRNCASAPFLDELEAIERPNHNIRLIVTMTEDEAWPGERRRIDADFVKSHLGKSFNEASYMVAGPPGFAKAVSAELEQAGVDSARIATDSFSGYWRCTGAPDIVFAYDRVSKIGSGDEAFRFELSYGRGLDLTADGTLVFRAFVLVGHEAIGGSAYSWESEALEASVGSVESERMLEEGVAALAERLQEGLRVIVAELPERTYPSSPRRGVPV